MRLLNRETYLGLKSATRRMVSVFGGQDAAQECPRVSPKQISRYCSIKDDHIDQFMPIDILADLISESKDTTVLRQLARLAHCELIELPQMPNGFADLQVAMGKSAKEFGEVISSIGVHIGDGKWDKAERKTDLKEIDDAIMALLALRKLAERGEGDE
ncbi:phage regulatory CII family protein [uncultured Maritalea sp.]|uniref:phage regulatory CII family protein n=1 Tax=uncultured Maritalea sp. TaxID=757249 RepID=UPI002628A89A|nr:phage regulatory CII family protein [uncultured Maritalea sp.]